MSKVRATLISAIAIGLLAGSAVGAAAQDADATASTDMTWPQLTTGFVYGEDDEFRQVIHVFEPEPRAEPRPAVVFFHGGALVFGTPLQDMPRAQAVAEQGYVTFMAGYRLFEENTGENPWPTQLDDAQRAVQWVRAHADEFNVDPGRVCAIGHSAGGHLAGLVGTTEAADTADSELAGISSRVDCVVTLAGDADLLVPYRTAERTNRYARMLGGTVEEAPELWKAASPAHNVDEETVPFLIIHGDRDRDTPVEMARNLAEALTEAGKEFIYAEVPAGHMEILEPEIHASLQEGFLARQLHPEE